LENPQSQTCTKCGQTKSLDEFPSEKRRASGKSPRCRACAKSYNAQRAQKPRTAIPEAKVCRRCGILKPIQEFGDDKYTRDGKATRCIICKKDESADYRKRNPEKVRAATAKWQAEHPVERAAYADKIRERKNARRRERYLLNKAKENAQNNAWYEANKETRKATMALWDEAHPGWHAAKSQRRRARQASVAIADLSPEQFEEIKIASNYRCAYCLDNCQACKQKTHVLHQEHIEPLVHGGNYTVQNILPSCGDCNSRKGTGPVPRPVQPFLLTIAPSHQPRTKKEA
jgi:hypothetical protein